MVEEEGTSIWERILGREMMGRYGGTYYRGDNVLEIYVDGKEWVHLSSGGIERGGRVCMCGYV